jgi:FixJ family two-component response regulator
MNEPVPDTGDRPRILIVEDDPGVRRSMQLLLQGQGFDVRAYASGGSLLADVAAANAVCLVADYRLDEGNGISILRALRQAGWMRPAILVTAFNSAQLQQDAREAGFTEVLEKPFREHALVHAVNRMVRT